MMPEMFHRWSVNDPPYGVPLQIYCELKDYIYRNTFTREELEEWLFDRETVETPNFYKIANYLGWRLTGIAKEMLSPKFHR